MNGLLFLIAFMYFVQILRVIVGVFSDFAGNDFKHYFFQLIPFIGFFK